MGPRSGRRESVWGKRQPQIEWGRGGAAAGLALSPDSCARGLREKDIRQGSG